MRFGFYLVFNWGGEGRVAGTGETSSGLGAAIGAQREDGSGKGRRIFGLEGYAGETTTVGREIFRFLGKEAGFDLTRISRKQFKVSVPSECDRNSIRVEIEDTSSNNTYINGRKIQKSSVTLKSGDLIGIVTELHDRNTVILGLRFIEDQTVFGQTPQKIASGPPTLPTTTPPALSNPAQPNRNPLKRPRVPEGGNAVGTFSLWNGILRINGSRDGPLYACYALPASLQSQFPPPWEAWPSTIVLQSRHRVDNASDKRLMEKFVDANKLACFAFSSLHERNPKLELLAEELSQRREFFCGNFARQNNGETANNAKVQKNADKQQCDFLITVGCVLTRSQQHSTLPIHDRAIVGFFSSKSGGKSHNGSHMSQRYPISGGSWMSTRFLVRNLDREALKELVEAAMENGGTDFASEKLKPCKYPSHSSDVDYVFVPEKTSLFSSFAWTLHPRLCPNVKIMSVSPRAFTSGSLRKGPAHLLQGNLCREVFKRGGLIFVDGAFVIENLHNHILEKLYRALVRYHGLVDRDEWTILFRESELRTLIDLGRFSGVAAKAIWEPLRGCLPTPCALRFLSDQFEFYNTLSQESSQKKGRPSLHVVDDSWPNQDTLHELFNNTDLTAQGRQFRYIISLADTRELNQISNESLSTASVSQEMGLGIQRMQIEALILWLEGLRHAMK